MVMYTILYNLLYKGRSISFDPNLFYFDVMAVWSFWLIEIQDRWSRTRAHHRSKISVHGGLSSKFETDGNHLVPDTIRYEMLF